MGENEDREEKDGFGLDKDRRLAERREQAAGRAGRSRSIHRFHIRRFPLTQLGSIGKEDRGSEAISQVKPCQIVAIIVQRIPT